MCHCNFVPASLPINEPEDQGQDDAYEQRRGEGEIKGKILAFIGKITGEASQPGDLKLARQKKKGADDGNDDGGTPGAWGQAGTDAVFFRIAHYEH